MTWVLKMYSEIHRNNKQTTYQSKLHAAAQSKSIYSLTYIDLFVVFVLMQLTGVADD